MDFKRCQAKWYWRWILGLILRQPKLGALQLGEWVHAAFDSWYGSGTDRSETPLEQWFARAAHAADIDDSDPEFAKLLALGHDMMSAYQQWYGNDSDVYVIAKEVPLEFEFQDGIRYKLKPDMVFSDPEDRIWIMEHKTAASIRTGHLSLDDQARPYAAMAQCALRNAGILSPKDTVEGVMYNYIRKGHTDKRAYRVVDGKPVYLNKDGSVSKNQPPEQFLRLPITLTKAERRISLYRAQQDARNMLRARNFAQNQGMLSLSKTPHWSCRKFCDYFAMCELQESGGFIGALRKSMYTQEDPYAYYQNSIAEQPSFEMGG